ncbi:MAG: transcriptional regulator, partial [Actinobacteria bacterium]|nr:transcriptional regulator [Actinomycetota bacterium]
MAGKKREAVVAGTGNVFQDLGLTGSEDRKLRVQLAVRLNELIDEHRLSQAAVAKRFGVPQPHVSDLRNYKLSRFSSERLVRFITLLDRDIDIVIRPRDSA